MGIITSSISKTIAAICCTFLLFAITYQASLAEPRKIGQITYSFNKTIPPDRREVFDEFGIGNRLTKALQDKFIARNLSDPESSLILDLKIDTFNLRDAIPVGLFGVLHEGKDRIYYEVVLKDGGQTTRLFQSRTSNLKGWLFFPNTNDRIERMITKISKDTAFRYFKQDYLNNINSDILVRELVAPLAKNVLDLCQYRETQGKWPKKGYQFSDRQHFDYFDIKTSTPDFLVIEFIPRHSPPTWSLELSAPPGTKNCESATYKIVVKDFTNPAPLVITGNGILTENLMYDDQLRIAREIEYANLLNLYNYQSVITTSDGYNPVARMAVEVAIRVTADLLACAILSALLGDGGCH